MDKPEPVPDFGERETRLIDAINIVDFQLEQMAHDVPADFRRPINKLRIILTDALAAFRGSAK